MTQPQAWRWPTCAGAMRATIRHLLAHGLGDRPIFRVLLSDFPQVPLAYYRSLLEREKWHLLQHPYARPDVRGCGVDHRITLPPEEEQKLHLSAVRLSTLATTQGRAGLQPALDTRTVVQDPAPVPTTPQEEAPPVPLSLAARAPRTAPAPPLAFIKSQRATCGECGRQGTNDADPDGQPWSWGAHTERRLANRLLCCALCASFPEVAAHQP